MKKILFSLMITTLLTACVQNTSEDLLIQSEDADTEVVYLTPQEVTFQPDEEMEVLKTIPELSVQQESDKRYSEWLAKKLRKELRSTGIQVKEVGNQIDLIVPNKIAFGNNQMQLLADLEESMNSIVSLLKEYDQTMIQIIGYTDDTGSVLNNKELSFKKAEIIADFLKKNGIDSGRIITDGAGSENPVATNATSAGREKNRRVEMTFISLQ